MTSEKVKYEVKRHFSDATAITTIMTPVYATLETIVVGMSDNVSLNSRFISTALNYGGLASLTKLRDVSKKLFKIGKDTKESVKGIHDILFAITFIGTIKPLIYLASGAKDFKEIAFATGVSLIAGALAAYPTGYLVDVYRDLLGVEESGRLPKFLQDKTPRTKKTLATVLTAGSIGLTALIYNYN